MALPGTPVEQPNFPFSSYQVRCQGIVSGPDGVEPAGLLEVDAIVKVNNTSGVSEVGCIRRSRNLRGCNAYKEFVDSDPPIHAADCPYIR